jgi:glycosyltransferase involved in cell wall biosynthesis
LLTAWITYRVLLPAADHVFVQSERMAQMMEKHGAGKSKLTAIPMGIDLERLQTKPEPLCEPRLHGRRVIAYLGALDRIRRADFLLEIVAQLKQEFPEILLVLIGDAAAEHDRLWLDDRIEALQLQGHVLRTGWLPMTEAWRWAAASEVGLSPIPPGVVFDVSSPTKAIEYMALGLPVVATDIPDQTSLLQESGAGVVTPFDAASFSMAVRIFLRDPELAVQVGAAGPAYIAAHRSYAVISQQLASRYRALQVEANDADATLRQMSGRLR